MCIQYERVGRYILITLQFEKDLVLFEEAKLLYAFEEEQNVTNMEDVLIVPNFFSNDVLSAERASGLRTSLLQRQQENFVELYTFTVYKRHHKFLK